MGRRGRRRARDAATKAASAEPNQRRSLPEDQRMARVNIRLDRWDAFREAATEADRSVAEYLGHLVEKELRRVARRQWRERAEVEHETRVLVTAGRDTQDEVM